MEQFISEQIKPSKMSFETRQMSIGGPGLPQEFIWRNKKITIKKILKSWRTTGPCRHGSGEIYVRRHWFEIETLNEGKMKIYFDQQPSGGSKHMGWWIFSIIDK